VTTPDEEYDVLLYIGYPGFQMQEKDDGGTQVKI
jgi:hypothetical protein